MSDTRYDTPEPFKVDIPERALIDLDERLRRWRAPVAIADNGSGPQAPIPTFSPSSSTTGATATTGTAARRRSTAGPTTWSTSARSACISSASPAPRSRARRARCRWSSPMAGRVRSSSSCTSSMRSPIPRTTAAIRSTPSTSSCPRSPATASRPADSRGRQHWTDRSARHRRPVAQARARDAELPSALRRAGRRLGRRGVVVGRLRPSPERREERVEVGRRRPAPQHDGARPGIDLRTADAQRQRESLACQGPGRARREDRLSAHPGDQAADPGRGALPIRLSASLPGSSRSSRPGATAAAIR